MAGMLSLINDARLNAGLKSLGYVNTKLYSLMADAGVYSSCDGCDDGAKELHRRLLQCWLESGAPKKKAMEESEPTAAARGSSASTPGSQPGHYGVIGLVGQRGNGSREVTCVPLS